MNDRGPDCASAKVLHAFVYLQPFVLVVFRAWPGARVARLGQRFVVALEDVEPGFPLVPEVSMLTCGGTQKVANSAVVAAATQSLFNP